jgi:hypothetical protein
MGKTKTAHAEEIGSSARGNPGGVISLWLKSPQSNSLFSAWLST